METSKSLTPPLPPSQSVLRRSYVITPSPLSACTAAQCHHPPSPPVSLYCSTMRSPSPPPPLPVSLYSSTMPSSLHPPPLCQPVLQHNAITPPPPPPLLFRTPAQCHLSVQTDCSFHNDGPAPLTVPLVSRQSPHQCVPPVFQGCFIVTDCISRRLSVPLYISLRVDGSPLDIPVTVTCAVTPSFTVLLTECLCVRLSLCVCVCFITITVGVSVTR